MKKSIAFVALFLGSLVVSCTQENEEINLDNIQAPTNIDATLTIKQLHQLGKVLLSSMFILVMQRPRQQP